MLKIEPLIDLLTIGVAVTTLNRVRMDGMRREAILKSIDVVSSK